MSRKLYRILPPLKGKRKFWTVQLRLDSRRLQRSSGNSTQAAAREFALLPIRQEAPHLIDERLARLAKL